VLRGDYVENDTRRRSGHSSLFVLQATGEVLAAAANTRGTTADTIQVTPITRVTTPAGEYLSVGLCANCTAY
jgi:hypothetical protein